MTQWVVRSYISEGYGPVIVSNCYFGKISSQAVQLARNTALVWSGAPLCYLVLLQAWENITWPL